MLTSLSFWELWSIPTCVEKIDNYPAVTERARSDVLENGFLLPSAGQDDSRCFCTHGSSWVQFEHPKAKCRFHRPSPLPHKTPGSSGQEDATLFPKSSGGASHPLFLTVDLYIKELKMDTCKVNVNCFSRDRSVLSRSPMGGQRDWIFRSVTPLNTIDCLKPHIVGIPWMYPPCLELETENTSQGLKKMITLLLCL